MRLAKVEIEGAVCLPTQRSGFRASPFRAPDAVAGLDGPALPSGHAGRRPSGGTGGRAGGRGGRGRGTRKVASVSFSEVADPVKFLLLVRFLSCGLWPWVSRGSSSFSSRSSWRATLAGA